MQDNFLYEYAVIRIVPKVEREEFLNVGIILFSKRAKFLKSICLINAEKLRCFSTETDLDEITSYVTAFENIGNGNKNCGPIAEMDQPERFRWLTAVRSSVLQTSRPHPGFSADLDATLQRLFNELVA